MFNEVMIVGGLFWSATYLLMIRRGFKDKTFGMPFAALCANISWEAIFAFVTPHSSPQIYINYVWFSLDVVIVYHLLKYGKKEFPQFSSRTFYPVFVLGLGTALVMILAVGEELDDSIGMYAAFGQNLMMSVLFVTMLLGRNDLRGQSIYIALFKLLGTGLSSTAFYLYRPGIQDSVLMQFLFVAIFVFDIIYFVMVYQKSKEQGIVWKRF
ncbi:MAG: hypothetical protein OEM77_06265 [Nitrosopumilus sp.]|nr:hypothetical protein [Nitrosopumilus sp.]MDH3737169.1 hypothetical protein [Nitrosopumilus sp.]